MMSALKETLPFAKWMAVCGIGLFLATWAFGVFFAAEAREWLALPYALGGILLLVYGGMRLVNLAAGERE